MCGEFSREMVLQHLRQVVGSYEAGEIDRCCAAVLLLQVEGGLYLVEAVRAFKNVLWRRREDPRSSSGLPCRPRFRGYSLST